MSAPFTKFCTQIMKSSNGNSIAFFNNFGVNEGSAWRTRRFLNSFENSTTCAWPMRPSDQACPMSGTQFTMFAMWRNWSAGTLGQFSVARRYAFDRSMPINAVQPAVISNGYRSCEPGLDVALLEFERSDLSVEIGVIHDCELFDHLFPRTL